MAKREHASFWRQEWRRVHGFSCAAVRQGEDVMHDAIRQQQVQAGVPALIATALTDYQGQNEEVLWAALFSLAVLIREGAQPYELSITAAIAAGLLPLLKVALKDYQVCCSRQQESLAWPLTVGTWCCLR